MNYRNDFVKLDRPDKYGNTHQCIAGPFCWMYGRFRNNHFIPSSHYGTKILKTIKEWENP